MELMIKESKQMLYVSKKIFDCKFNEALVHQVITAYAARSRQGSCAQKSRAEVAGSGKKPWRQKGTGRARAGSVSSPIWRSGGVTFAAKPRQYLQKINKKMYKGALRSIFSELVRKKRFFIVEEFSISSPKTTLLLNKLKKIVISNVLIVLDKLDKNVFLASRNIYKVNICHVLSINPISLISSKNVLLTTNSIKKLEEILK